MGNGFEFRSLTITKVFKSICVSQSRMIGSHKENLDHTVVVQIKRSKFKYTVLIFEISAKV